MKITIDVSQMTYEGTGVGRYTKELCRALLEANSGHQFTFWAGSLRQINYFKNLSKTKPWAAASWIFSPFSPKLAGKMFNLLPFNLDSIFDSPDLLHTSDWSEPNTKAPRVTTVHDLVFAKYPETLDPLILSTQKIRLNKLSQNSTTIIADSLSTKNDLVEMYHFDPQRINVVYPGINRIFTMQNAQEIERVKTKYNLPDQFVLALGTQEPRKNLPRLIEASKLTNLPLVIAGKYGWGEAINPPAHVQVLGFVEELDLPAIYSAASVFVLPSLYEGFGFPSLEAMACGTPVVVSNTSSLPEVVGDAAILVDPLSVESISRGIIQAIQESPTRRTLSLTRAASFSWENTAKQVLEVYDKVIKNGN